MSVPPDNSDQLDRLVGRSAFGSDAAGYHKARSGYPDKLFEHLAKIVPPNPSILEIGAGTGLATAGLLRCSPRLLTLVEPDPRLCEVLADRFSGHGVMVICGAFPEAIPEGQYDLVACAAAFHWMEPEQALSGVRSLLAPGGKWAMWWNCYFGHGEPDPFGDCVSQILNEHDVALPQSYQGRQHYALNAELHFQQLEAAGFHGIENHVMREFRDMTADEARALYETFSFISVLPTNQQEIILDQIANIVDKGLGGCARSVVVTSLYCASG